MNNFPAAQSNPSKNPGFKRRWRPVGPLRPVGDVADDIMHKIATRAVRHWLRKAENYGDERRTACLATAASIARRAGLDEADLIEQRAA